MRQLAFVCFALALGCSINKRSDGFACTSTSDCDTGRVCESGFCVVTAGSGSSTPEDAPRSLVDGPRTLDAAEMCPPQCTTCDLNGKTCDINCEDAAGTCAQNITCPEGFTCTIECTTPGSCRQNIDCSNAEACTLTCSASQSCAKVTCGSGACDLMCTGSHSCAQVDCSNSCACDATCSGSTTACENSQFMCPTNELDEPCTGLTGGCSSTFMPDCNTCQ
ncbi:MAG TPA: hypothetical protein VGG74_01710 [Kofleriaceae bacterium]